MANPSPKSSLNSSIPSDWEVMKGVDISDKITKGSSPNWQGFQYQDSGVLFVTSENVRNGFLDVSEPKYLPFAFNEKLKNSVLKKGDVLINIVGASIGRSCIYSLETVANTNQAVCILRPKETVLREYVSYFLQLPQSIDKLLSTQSDSARPNLTLDDIRNFHFLLPPLPEQRAIAACLNTWDKAITNLQTTITLKQQQKKWLMQLLLTGKKRLKGFSGEWKEVRLGDFGKIKMCRRVFNEETSSEGEIPFYKIGTFGKQADAFITEKLYDEYRAKFSFPKKGEILISAAGTLGRTVIYDGSPAYFQDSNIVWVSHDESQVINEYLYYAYEIIRYDSEGGTIQRLYNSIISNSKLYLPSIKEQAGITQILQAADKEIQLLKTKLAQLKEQKKGLMQILLTGHKRLKIKSNEV